MIEFDLENSYKAIFNSAIDAIIVIDQDSTVLAWSPGAETLLGWTSDEIVGKDMSIIVPPQYREAHNAGMKRYMATRQARVIGLPYIKLSSLHKDGHEIPTNFTVASWEEEGTMFFTGILRDVTGIVANEERQNILIKELNHRVKNTLAVLNGVIAQTSRDARTVEQFQASLQERIFAISKTHDLLVETNWSHTTLESLLKVFVDPFKFPYFYDGPDADEVKIKPAIAVSIGMALNELVTNCIKYGAWSDGGHVVITGDRKDGESIFVWKERGGPKVVEPAKKSFGCTLLERVLPVSIRGEAKILWEPDGIRYVVKGKTNILKGD